MNFSRAWHSLSFKLTAAFALVISACALGLAVSGYLDSRAVLQREAEARYNSITENAAFNMEYGVFTRHISSLQQIAEGLLQLQDVNFIDIRDANGESLLLRGVSRPRGRILSVPIRMKKLDPESEIESLFEGNIEFSETSRPKASTAKTEILGEVRIEFDTSFIQEKLNLIQKRAIAISLLTVILGLILSVLLSRLLVAPIEDLAQAASRAAEGDLDHKVQKKSMDEIGELADAFNVMLVNLKNSTVSRDFLDSLLDSIPEAILVTGEDNRIRSSNKGAQTLLQIGESEMVGEELSRFLSIKDGELLPASAERIPVSVSMGELKNKDGQPVGSVFVAHDLRPIRKLQERLLQSEKMAAVGQLAAGVSHEINNPLGVILGFAQGLCRRLEPGHPLEVPLRAIERESTRCKDLVQDLLTFSRSSHIDREPIDLNQAVEGALSLVLAQARMDQAEVRRNLTPNLPKILGSQNQIQQVIINLAKNAMDAVSAGSIIEISTELETTKTASWVCLRVKDTGAGIPPEILPRIFEPFFTTKPVGKGTGLGLSLVYEVVKRHSGLLDVKSRPGETEFTIRFPIRTGREADGGDSSPKDGKK